MEPHLRITKNFSLLKEIAIATPKISGAKIAAAIVMKNKIISIGVNSYKTHPIQARFATNKGLSIHLHAEIAAIKNAMYYISVEDFKKATLLICRVKIDIETNKYVFGMAKPCIGCQRAIEEFDIKHVWYSLDKEGFYKV